MSSTSTFVCVSCGREYLKWQGKCSACGEWNSIVEEKGFDEKHAKGSGGGSSKSQATLIELSHADAIDEDVEKRIDTKIGEFNRVLGGGAVEGSVILLGGEPGIGKSTMLLQVSAALSNERKVIYLSGEESKRQVKMRTKRLGMKYDKLFFAGDTNVDNLIKTAYEERPDVIIADSIQTLFSPELKTSPGSISQIKDSAVKLMNYAKDNNVLVFIIGHINKEGSIAGPKVLEHIVDCVLYFEGDSRGQYRIVRGVKNRFGAIDEIGIFEMTGSGLKEVEDAAYIFTHGHEDGLPPGTVITAALEGSRVFCVEEQALVSTTVFGYPRRLAMGFDYNRLLLICAIIEKRAGMRLDKQDVHVNVAEGLKVKETASDLSVAMAIVSSLIDTPLPKDTAYIGELGLSGEIRPVRFIEKRVKELLKFGLNKIFMSPANLKEFEKSGLENVELNSAASIRELIDRQFQA